MSEFMQFIFSGVTVGAVYALVALGFAIIFNATGVVNFAQGEFVMLAPRAGLFSAMAMLMAASCTGQLTPFRTYYIPYETPSQDRARRARERRPLIIGIFRIPQFKETS